MRGVSGTSTIRDESDPARGPFCAACGFSLFTAPVHGICSECGVGYTEAEKYWVPPWPSLGKILSRLAWPLVLFLPILYAIYADAAQGSGHAIRALGVAMICGGVGVFALLITSFIVARRIVRSRVPPWRIASTRGQVFIGSAWFIFLLVIVLATAPLGAVIFLGFACLDGRGLG